MRLSSALALCLYLLAAPATAEAALYKWVDAQGGVHVSSDLQAVPAAQRDAAIRGAETRPALIHGPTRRAPTGQDSADVPERNHRDQWATLGEDRRARRSTVERQIVLLEARRLELVTQGANTRPPNNRVGKISRHRIERYRARYTEWERIKKQIRQAKSRLERLP